MKCLSSNIRYILPLRRNSALIDYSVIKGGDRSKFTGHFLFENRVIWHYREGNSVILYLDESLKTEEERDFLSGERPDLNAFFERQYQQGTIAVVTNLPYSEEKIYGLLKNRVDVEQAFDAFKNVLNADRSYMRDNYQLEGWFLINFVALLLYYRIYNTLLEKGMLNNYSPRDVLLHLSRVFKMEINGRWVTSEIQGNQGF
ncbi:MAG: transposase [Nitrososphaerota archaeon]|nr:transposase [Nitrososphaerota archaeon]